MTTQKIRRSAGGFPVVFDNEGKTFDQYSIITKSGDMFGASTEPFMPHGHGQYCGNVSEFNMSQGRGMAAYIKDALDEPGWLGKEVKDLNSLPAQVIQYIKHIR